MLNINCANQPDSTGSNVEVLEDGDFSCLEENFCGIFTIIIGT